MWTLRGQNVGCIGLAVQPRRNFRNTIHALAPRHRRLARRLGLARARPPSAANAAPSPPSRRETAGRPGTGGSGQTPPACVIVYRRALRVDMKNDGEAVAPRDRSTGGRDGPRRMVRMARYQTPRRARGPDPPARQGPTTRYAIAKQRSEHRLTATWTALRWSRAPT